MLKGWKNITKKLIAMLLSLVCILSTASPAFAEEAFYWDGSAETESEKTEYETELAESIIEDLTLTSENDAVVQEEPSDEEEVLHKEDVASEQEDQPAEDIGNEVVYTDEEDVQDEVYAMPADIVLEEKDSDKEDFLKVNVKAQAGSSDTEFRIYFWQYDGSLPQDANEWETYFTDPCENIVIEGMDEFLEMDLPVYTDNGEEDCTTASLIYESDDDVIKSVYLDFSLSAYMNIDTDLYVGIDNDVYIMMEACYIDNDETVTADYLPLYFACNETTENTDIETSDFDVEEFYEDDEFTFETETEENDPEFDDEFDDEFELETEPVIEEETEAEIQTLAAGDTAFAIYSETDNSLTFYAGSSVPSAGSTYNGKTATNVYTGFETETWSKISSIPWYSLRTSITKVVIDNSFKNVQPVSLAYWFYYMSNAIFEGLENIDTSKVTTLVNTFNNCSSLANVDGLSGWDITKVTTLHYTFCNCSSLTNVDGLSGWNTSNVTTLYGTFNDCSSLANVDGLSGWDISKVTTLQRTFYNCSNLTNVDGLSGWDTSNVTTLEATFRDCSSLTNVDGLSGWDTSNVTTLYCTFYGCSSLANVDGLSEWDTSNVTTLYYTFRSCSNLTSIDTGNWDTAKVKNMQYMFYGCSSLETIYSDDSNFVTSAVTSGTYMFNNCSKLVGGNGTKYSSSKATYTMAHVDTEDNPGYFTTYREDEAFAVYSGDDNSLTFYYGIVPEEGGSYKGKTVTNVYTGFETETWSSYSSAPWYSIRTSITKVVIDNSFKNVQPVSLAYWFYQMTNLKSFDGLENIDTSNVTTLYYTFYGCTSLTNVDGLSGWDTSNVTTLQYTFRNCSDLTNVDCLSGWDTSNITTLYYTFYGCSSLANVDGVSGWNTSNVTTLYGTFWGCNNLTNVDGLSGWDTSNVTTLYGAFYGCANLANVDGLSGWDTSNVTTLYYTFYNCSSLANVDGLSGWDTSNVTTLQYTFRGCSSLTNVDGLSEWDASNVTTLYQAFYGCSNLTNVDGLSGWNTSNVTTLYYTFYNCSSLANVDGLSEWDASNVTTLYQTFYGCNNLTNVDGLSRWDTSNVTTLNGTFYKCSSLTSVDISGWNTTKVTNMGYMFNGCSSLKTIYSNDYNFVTTAVTSGNYMFTDCSKLVGGNGTAYSSSNVTYEMAHVDTASNPGYFTNVKRTSLTTDNKNYTYYKTVQDAIDAAGSTSGSIVALLENITEDVTIASGQNLTLDLNGCTLTGTGSASVIKDYGTLTIKDSGSSGTITGGSASNGGGIYVYADGKLTIDGGTISGNKASSHGGGIYATGATVTVNNGTISDNSAGSEGGGIRIAGTTTLTINGGTVTKNTSTAGGGGLMFGTNGVLNLNGGTISNNTAGSYGGGLYGYYGTLNMTGGTFTGNQSTTYGAGIFLNGSMGTISNGSITNNKSTTYAAGVQLTATTLTMSGGEITENTATTYGGGLSLNATSTFNMKGGKISNNTATTHSGGIYNNGTLTIDGGTIENNTATTYGGGVYTASSGSAVFNSGSVTNNNAGARGGGFYVTDGSLEVNGGTISGNTTGTEYGGGIAYVSASSGSINGGTISGNTAGSYAGGIIVGASASVTMKGGTVTGNTSTTYAGGILANGTFTMTGGNIYQNTALTYASDVRCGSSSQVTLTDVANTGLKDSNGHDIIGWYDDSSSSRWSETNFTSKVSGLTFSNTAKNMIAAHDSSLFAASLTTDSKNYTYYLTVQEAVNAAGTTSGSIVTMLKNTTENLTIASGQNLTLDLAGYTLTGTGSATVITLNGTMTLKDSGANGTITGGKGTNGGGINVSGGSLTMDSGTIKNNTANQGGGIRVASSGSLTINGGTISNNSTISTASYPQGGAIYVSGSSTVNINGGTITDNYADTQGGGIYLYNGPTINITGGTISNNTSGTYGGGIAATSSTTVKMTGGTITGNTAGSYGGGISVTSSTLTMSGGTISKNKAVTNGGGIYTNNTVTISGGSIESNTCDSYGAGIYITGGSASISAGDIKNNASSTRGGGIYVTGGTVTMTGGTISGNTSVTYGAGIAGLSSSTITINGGTISGNTATTNGGGIYNSSSTTNIIKGTVSGNTANSYGGGVYITGGTFSMDAGDVKNNVCNDRGGGIYATGAASSLTLNGGTIDGNTCVEHGGGIYVVTNASFTMNDCSITNNTAGNWGGGIYLSGSITGAIKGGILKNNTASYGGGIMIYNGCTLSVSGGEFSGNTASYGGGITVNGSTAEMTKGTVSGNKANSYGGGVYVYTSGTFNMTGGDVYNNTATSYGADFQIASGSNATLKDLSGSGLKDSSGHDITGWHLDNSGNRWSESNITDEASSLSISGAAGLIAAHGHTYTEGSFIWSSDYKSCTKQFVCSICGDIHEETCTVTSVTTDPTCTKTGSIVYTAKCTFEGTSYSDTKTTTLAATGHSYGSPTYTWSSDYSSCTAKFTCTSNDDTQTITCSVTKAETAATCTSAGKWTYTATCTFEGKSYTDTKTSTIAATGHSYGSPTYTWSSDYSTCTAKFTCTSNDDTQTINCTVTKAETKATCTATGKWTYTATCTFEGKSYTDTKTSTIAATGHSYGSPDYTWASDYSSCTAKFTCTSNDDTQTITCTVTKAETAATCTADGKWTYTATCTFEGKSYTDTKTSTISALGHSYGSPYYEWSSDHSSCRAEFTCSRCKDVQTVQCTITHVENEPSCTDPGNIVYTAQCTFNGTAYTDTRDIVTDPYGHDFKDPSYVWSDAYDECTAVFQCGNCNGTEEIACTISSVTTDPECIKEGNIVYTASCTFEGSNFTDKQTVVLPALGHSYSSPSFTWSGDYSSCEAVFTCSACSDKQTVKCDISYTATEATCTQDGAVYYNAVCEFEGNAYSDDTTKILKATGHSFESPSFTWSDGYTECTAVFPCENCSYTESTACTVSSKTANPTCTEDGSIVYSSSCVFEDKSYSDSQTVVLSALGHAYELSEFTWADDFESCTAEFICSACSDRQAVKCDVSSRTVEPTCTEDGVIYYAAVCEFEGNAYSSDEEKILPAEGHSYGDPEFTWLPGYQSCTAEFVCSICDFAEYISCEIDEVTVDPACTESGYITYTAACALNEKTHSDIQTVELLATGHSYGDPEFIWSEDCYESSAVFTCANCGDEQKINCEVKADTGSDTTTFTASVISPDETVYSDTKEVSNTAFAIYSTDDDSLTFYYGAAPTAGGKYSGKTVTNVYTGFETDEWSAAADIPWYSICASIKTVIIDSPFKDVRPVSLAYWFYGMTNAAFEGLENIDTSEVTTLESAFYNCSGLANVDGLSAWDVSNVTTLYEIFYDCSSLENADGLNGWNTSQITTLERAFYGCDSLTSIKALNAWNTSNVKTVHQMFRECSSLENIDISFDTSKIQTFSQWFYGCSAVEEADMTNVNVSSATTFANMFNGCSSLQVIDLTGWNSSNVTSMNSMFANCTNLVTIYEDRDFDMSSSPTGTNMFSNCSSLIGGNGTKWDSSNITNTMACIDKNGIPGYFTDSTDQAFAVYSEDDGSLTFYYGKIPSYGKIYNGKTATNIYSGIKSTGSTSSTVPWYSIRASIQSVMFDPSFENVQPVATAYWFYGMTNCTEIEGLEFLDTENVTDMQYMFYNCSSLTNLDVCGFDTTNVTNMNSIFQNCSSIAELDVCGFDTTNVTDMAYMFSGCSSLTNLDVSWFDTTNVTDMAYMFSGCSSLTNLDVSGFNTKNVTDMRYMFYNCSSLAELDVRGFDTGNVTDMGYMFYGCSSLTELDVSGFDTGNVKYMCNMFENCASLKEIDVSKWDTSNVYEFTQMFLNCASLLYLDLSSFDTSKKDTDEIEDLLTGCTSLLYIKIGDAFDLFEYYGAIPDQENWYDESGNLVSDNYLYGISEAGTYYTYRTEFDWSDDCSSCTATFSDYYESSPYYGTETTVDCILTSEVTIPVSCTEDGETLFTAQAEEPFIGITHASEKIMTYPTTGHDWFETDEVQNGSSIDVYFECANCRATKHESVMAEIVSESGMSGSIDIAEIPWHELIGDEELASLDDDAVIDIVLVMEDINETVPEEDAALVEELLQDEDAEVFYIEIDLALKVSTSDGETTEYDLHEVAEPVTVTVAIPETMQTDRKGEYTVIRVHDDEAEMLETMDNGDWTLTFSTDKFSTYAIAFLAEELIDVSGTKTWDDDNNRDGIRPDNITVHLFADGEETDSAVISEDDDWTYEFTELSRFRKSDGEEIEYTLSEDPVEGYETIIDGYNITNIHEPELLEIDGFKTWDDADNQDGNRPESIGIELFADGETIETIYVTAEDDWEWSFSVLPKYRDGGIEIQYAVMEYVNEDYSTSYGENGEIINSYEPSLTSLSLTKYWDDNGDQDGIRSGSVTVELLADDEPTGQTIVLDESNNWTSSFEDLDEYHAGTKIEYSYTINEYQIEGYDIADVSGDMQHGYVITNHHTPETTEISGYVSWNDDDNRDGVRSEDVTIRLFADGKEIESTAAAKEDEWSWSFADLPKYRDGGIEIVYTITVDEIEAYETAVDGYDITMTHEPETIIFEGLKAWSDDGNRDGIRPNEITVHLLADEEEIDSLDVTSDDGWSWSFDDLLKYRDEGTEIEYTVKEDPVDGYETTLSGHRIINSHEPETINISSSITWDDDDNVDGIRPSEITVILLANGEETARLTATAADEWACVFEDFLKYKEGSKFEYSVAVEDIEGYEITIDGYNITLTHTPETIDVEGYKTWDDADNQDGNRPESIVIELIADGEAINTIDVTSDDDWSWNFSDLPKYRDEGIEIQYAVMEYVNEDYSTSYGENGEIINSYEPSKTSVSVTKYWDDNNNQDGIRAGSVTVELLADGEETGMTITLDESNNWTSSFEDLDEYHAGTKIEYSYTINEYQIDGYEITDVMGDMGQGFIITNRHEPETIDISSTVSWDDDENRDGIRPDNVKIHLFADDYEIYNTVLTENDDWSYVFESLPKYRDEGIEINYTVGIDNIDEYRTRINGYDIVNIHTPETISIQGAKTWIDDNNRDGIRPEEITVRLYADDDEIENMAVTEENEWSWTFENLPKYRDEGQDIIYSVKEDEIDGYTSETEGYDITNMHEPETISISGFKTWDDADNQDGIRPDNITVHLFADGEEIDNISITEEDEWSYIFDNLPKYRGGGIEIIYSITEDPLENYEASIDGYNITNAYVPETINIEGSKTWDDDNNRDGIRSEEITVRLYADDEEVAHMTASEADEWKWSFEDLPKYRDGGIEIVYTISEDAVEGYETSIEGYDITNMHKPETVAVSGFKTWDDADNQDGVRPDHIIIELITDGEVIESIEVTEDDDWSWSFDDLPKYRDGGIEIQYAVMEYVNEDYSTSYGEDGEIINHYEPSLTSVSVTKYWDDNDNQDGIRAGSVTVELLAEGEETGMTLVLDESNNWTSSFEDLDEYHAGTQIEYTYTIREYQIDGYDVADITGDMNEGYIITNHHEPETTSISGTKTWNDDNNRDGIRPDSITVHLFADEEEIDSMTVTEADEWSYTFDNLPKYRNEGIEIIYTVDEDPVDGYEADIDGYNITNIHVPETIDIKGSKTWEDNDDLDGLRPEEITIHLFADEEEVDNIVVTAEDEWSWQFTDLLKYRDEGTEIIYTIEEDAVDQYETVYDGYDITNRLKTYGFNLQKTDDAGDEINGAAFTLSKEDRTILSFVKDNDVYIQCADNDENATTELPAGSIRLEGLPEGTYILKEMQAPDGYLALKDEIVLTISEDGVSVDNGNDQVSVEEDTVIVENVKASALLSTGGIGTGWMLFLAIAMIAASATLLVFCSRKHSYN